MTFSSRSIYVAAPLFTEEERQHNRKIRDLLLRHYRVYLPQEDGELIFELIEQGIPVPVAKQTIFESDVRAIKECDVLLIVLDGRTVDEGAAFELGMAYALGKRCWALKTDPRSLFAFGDNPMIEQAVSHTFRSLEELIAHINDGNGD